MTRATSAIRVLHVSYPTDGGTARCVRDYAIHLNRRGWDVVVASPPDGWLPREVRRHRLGHVTWRATREPSVGTVAEVAALVRIVRDVRPEVVHLHSSKAGLAGRLALRGRLPTVFQPHAWSFEATTALQRRLSVRWERAAARWADVVVCVSRSEMLRGLEVGVDARYRVVTNGIDLSAWPPARSAEKLDARRRLDLPDAPTVVCVGRLTVQKGQDVLLDAWPRVHRAVPAANLVIVGDGPEGRRLRSRSTSNVRFTGERADVRDWIAAADVVAIPSRWEGMSLSLLEAMARGRAIVATDAAGVRDALRNRTGAVVAIESPDELADQISTRLRDPARIDVEGRTARALAEQYHDLTRSLEGLSSIYEDVLARRGSVSGWSSATRHDLSA
jgi:glycosyltransferase involved in cell wall biosynthesis